MTKNSSLKPEPCPECGLSFQCLCPKVPKLKSETEIILLTHPNEIQRDTNSGKILTQTLKHCTSYIWNRKQPDPELLQRISSCDKKVVLLFPSDHSCTIDDIENNTTYNSEFLFIILDSTWQEARKMLNKSHWLKEIPTIHLTTDKVSGYSLRKNQHPGNLCTCEVGIELLHQLGEATEAKQLSDYFEHYLSVFKADKSGHQYKES